MSSSQSRNRANRGGTARSGGNNGEEQDLWNTILHNLRELDKGEKRAAEIKEKIIRLESGIAEKTKAGAGQLIHSICDLLS